ncbi:flagellar hook-associated protein FlgL [Bacillus sp. H-16]|uniref:flagellar hook-associated protein FlgL n=1 Tax=Alteribacter salitolerans TaxID=2912333 RepID=UPI00196235E5|nr:flagellar hook-associated protein FlgL [Alteribacter salitolerans]MBM7096847.1 flagellar hook-associated protein FlgL [Alteribacter salitolerans]
MRVTQSMLSNNSLRHLSQSYQQLHTLQNQLATGKKISRASEDPVVAMNGMRYRTQVTEIEQFKRNLGEVNNWMDNSDATLDKVAHSLHRVRELTVQASNDTYEGTQRDNIAKEVEELRKHLQSLANTKSNGKYIFNGTNTTNEPVRNDLLDAGLDSGGFQNWVAGEETAHEYHITHHGVRYDRIEDGADIVFESASGDRIVLSGFPEDTTIERQWTATDADGNVTQETREMPEREIVISADVSVSTNNSKVEIELLKGVNMPVNIDPSAVFSSDFFGDLIQLEKALRDPDVKGPELTKFIDTVDHQLERVVNERAELGARQNRIEMMEDRVREQEVIAKRVLSDNEDADMERVISQLMSQENVHRAALASSARILQPSLMDFLR